MTRGQAILAETNDRTRLSTPASRMLARQARLNALQQALLDSGGLEQKLHTITEGIVDIFEADFCRIWVIGPGDLCEHGCVHADATEGPHVCLDRDHCLHLIASSGRYTHRDGQVHRRVPFGCYKIGRIASGAEHAFLINDVQSDPRVHNRQWAKELGLVSFAGYQLRPPHGETLGVLALFSKHVITPEDDGQLDALSTWAARVIATDRQSTAAEASLRESESRYRSILATAHAAAREEAAKLRAMIEGMEEGVVVANVDDIITDVNTWFLEKTGLARDQIVGKSLWDLHPDSATTSRLRAVLEQFQTGRRRETYVVNRELLGMHVLLRTQPIFRDGAYRGVVLNVINVTDLVQARRDAEAASQAKSLFLANMSHEIRTPMTAIQGFAEVIRDDLQCCTTCPSHGTCETRQTNLENINTVCSNAEHLLQVINDILDLSKIESGNISIETARVSPHEVLASVASLVRPRAAEKGIEFSVAYAGAIPKTIRSDPTRLREAILNLAANAIKFTETGSVTIRVGLNGTRDEPQLTVEVIDTGIGIPQDRLEAILEPFKQADSSTTRRFGGTGLGLTITRHIAGLLGGRLEVTSEVGKGSVFTLRVATGPLAGVELLEQPVEEAAPRPPAPMPPPGQPLNARVLLVEDGPDNRRLITHLLTKAGAEVDTADNGQQGAYKALAAMAEGRPYDVVLMDMQMPVMDGYQATQHLRQHGYERPIIALTAHAMSGDREKCMDNGCDDSATKPIDRTLLIETIRRHLP